MGVLLFHSVTETEQKSWYSIEPFTLLSTYKNLQKKFITLYSPYEPLLKSYREATNTQIFSISDNYLNKNSEVPEENVALLKNAIELWRKATQTTHAIAPILFHYSWHCFNSFFAYTFFRWGQKHSQSHGVYVSNMTDEMPCFSAPGNSHKENRWYIPENNGYMVLSRRKYSIFRSSTCFRGK